MRISFLILAAAVLSTPMAACAHDYDRARDGDDGLLSEPPADARAGQCFAKVIVPGQAVYGPPGPPQLRWVQSPSPPGAVGPLWCQVWEPGQPTMTLSPERIGWIRVICDKDATRERIGHVQRRLHDWGVYEGDVNGRYDAATADAVHRFQAERHIAHGGYLSLQTLEALDAPPPPPAQPPAFQPPAFQPPADYSYGYGPPAGVPPTYAPLYPGLAPCGAGPCGEGAPAYGQPGYTQNPDGVRSYSVQYSVTRTGRPGY